MNLYDIITIPDPILKQVAQPIETITPDIQKQAEKMIATVEAAPGIGLAANQIGILNRMIIFNMPENAWEFGKRDRNGVLEIDSTHRQMREVPRDPIVMINPEILKFSEEKSKQFEGCLSIPDQFADVIRPAHITARYLDLKGEQHDIELSGLDAHVVQHEIDHLNGVLFIDHISSLKKNMILRKFRKLNK